MHRPFIPVLAAIALAVACGDDGTSPSDCDLRCQTDGADLSINITCENPGSVSRTFNDQTTFTYDTHGNVSSYTTQIDQEWTFTASGNVYRITGTVTVDAVQDAVSSYSIQATGGGFGNTAATCSG